jgi:hypothetical protein
MNNHNQTLSATMHTRLKSHWPQFQPEVNTNDVILILFCIVLLFTISEQAGKVGDFHHKSRKRRLISTVIAFMSGGEPRPSVLGKILLLLLITRLLASHIPNVLTKPPRKPGFYLARHTGRRGVGYMRHRISVRVNTETTQADQSPAVAPIAPY